MNYLKAAILKIAFIAGMVCIFSCNYSQTYMPALNNQQYAILNALNKRYYFEHVQLQGVKSSGVGGSSAILTVKFINGKNLPVDDDKIMALEKELASQIKNTLKNPKEFERYIIELATKRTDGTETTESYIAHEFKVADL